MQSALIGIGDDKSKLLKVYQKLRMVHINLPSQKAAERRPCCVVSLQLVYRTVNTRYKRVTKMGRIFTKQKRISYLKVLPISGNVSYLGTSQDLLVN